jgi:hypothetical protein
MIRIYDSSHARIAAFATLAIGLIAAPPSSYGRDEAPDPAEILKATRAPLLIAFRPSALLDRPDLKAIYDDMTRTPEVKKVVDMLDPATIEQISFILLDRDLPAGPDAGDAFARSGAILVKTEQPREWKALAAASGQSVAKATLDGKEIYKVGDPTRGISFYQPDGTTLVAASDAVLRRVMAPSPRRAPLWEAVDLGDDDDDEPVIAVIALDFAWARKMGEPAIQADKQSALGLSLIGPIWEQTKTLVVTLSASDDDGLTVSIDHDYADADGATRAEATLEALLTLSRNVAPTALRSLRENAKADPRASDLADLAEKAVATADVSREENRVTLTISARADVAKLLKDVSRGR